MSALYFNPKNTHKSDFDAACTGKQRFPSRSDASTVIQTLNRKHKTNLNAYQCKACGGWHIGTPSHKKAK